MSGDDKFTRRTLLKSAGVAGILGTVPVAAVTLGGNGPGQVTEPQDSENNGPPTPPGERTLTWDKQRGSEHAEHECEPGEKACWHWVLTPGGQPSFEEFGDLLVTFADESEKSVSGSQAGEGAIHFNVCKFGGGEITDAEVEVTGGGPNAALTISDVECEPLEIEQVFWQLDFAAGDEPKIPPRYWPDDIMASLGNTHEGVTENPSLRRQKIDGQLGDIDIVDKQFQFDDDEQPTEVTVSFTVDEDGAERDLHLALFELPGPFDGEVDDQEYVRHESDTVGGGDSGSLTLSLDLS